MRKWKSIPEFDGLYEVSDDGQVRSLDHVTETSDGRMLPTIGRVLKQHIHGTSGCYKRPSVKLCVNGRRQTKMVCRLVAEAFHGPCPDGMECCHEDGDATNNRAENLRWDTSLANSADTIRHGKWCFGERIGTSKLKERDIVKIRRFAKSLTHGEIGKMFGVSRANISLILEGKRWAHVGVAA